MNKYRERTEEFRRNELLEVFLKDINNNLIDSEEKLLTIKEPEYPILFIVGPHRSGSTLLLQWLASLGSIAYPSNLMSRFYNAPILASKIQLLLTDEKYNYRNEIIDFNNKITFSSENGKTKGALSPNEYYYFWKRFIDYEKINKLTTEDLFKIVDTDILKSELAGITNVFKKPFALKGMIFNYNIDFLNRLFNKAIFIYTKREPLSNIESALESRKKQFGNIESWYSFKIPEYDELIKMNPYEQVAGQIHYINKAVETGLKDIPDEKKIVVNYEEFCENPNLIYNELQKKLALHGVSIDDKYISKKNFSVTRKNIINKDILQAYKKFN